MPKLVKKVYATEDDYLPNTLRIASLAADRKAIDICAYDVRNLTVIADVLVICSASSDPQLKAILNSVKDGMKEIGVAPIRWEGAVGSLWLVLDYGNIIFHLFREEARAFYDLDGLWADAPRIDLDLEV